MSLLASPLELHDETLRDGLQSASVRQPDLVGKLEILHAVADLGIRSANVGIPCASPRVAADVLRLVEEIVEASLDVLPTCAARTVPADVDPILTVADRTGCEMEVGMFLGTSPVRQLAEGWDLGSLLQWTEQAVRYAVDRGLRVMFVTEDTIRSRPEHVRRLYTTAVDCGAERVCLCDTVGCATPEAVRRLIRFVRGFLAPGIAVDWHGHNDRGLAVANSLAALEAGADRVHATALGVGERAGNTSMELLLREVSRRTGRPWDPERVGRYLERIGRELEVRVPPIWLNQAFKGGLA
ncbi:MAG: 2-isopropylmalate synthase [Candidatus Eremiobacterota bacterium]